MSAPFFIKGYKIDHSKLEKTYGKREDDPDNMRFLPIWRQFPLDYKYMDAGEEPDGNFVLVVVLADGGDREELEKVDIYTASQWTIRESIHARDLDPSLRKASVSANTERASDGCPMYDVPVLQKQFHVSAMHQSLQSNP